MSIKSQNNINLPDGRRLCFAEYGDRQGRPVFYFQGFPGLCLEARLAEKISLSTNVRFIGIDRHCYGLSNFKSGRTFIDWADDVAGLANALGIYRFSILGVSGGGSYAAACACKIPHRLDAVGIVCPMGPVDVPGLMQNKPWAYRRGLRLAGRLPGIAIALHSFSAFIFRKYPRLMLSILSEKVAAPDKIALQDTELEKILSTSFRDAYDFMLYLM